MVDDVMVCYCYHAEFRLAKVIEEVGSAPVSVAIGRVEVQIDVLVSAQRGNSQWSRLSLPVQAVVVSAFSAFF